MKILLLTPPLVQPNTPYPATPFLTGFLRGQGVAAGQADLSLELLLRLFSREGLSRVAAHCRAVPRPSAGVRFFLRHREAYVSSVESVVAFLQGRDETAGWRIARRDFLPEGPRFAALQEEGDTEGGEGLLFERFGSLGLTDRAKFLSSLYLDDLADVVREGVDPDFGFARYAERLAVSVPTFDPILRRLKRAPTWVDRLIDDITGATLERHAPDAVGITLPFPGTVYAAFRIAARIRQLAPAARVVMGGGYVNTEWRELNDPRVFRFVDEICFDEGTAPWLGLLGKGPRVRTMGAADCGVARPERDAPPRREAVLRRPRGQGTGPSYDGLELTRYLNLLETGNPMHRIWSDGRWIKLSAANGCYWHRCAFCDVSLDYIGRYQAPDVPTLVDTMLRLKRETGRAGFHFTDEALAPALIRALCGELRARGEALTWWGNIRFDRAFTPALVRQMAEAGCIAVTGGLECAQDRLLRLMRKGITLAGARNVCQAFSDAGILVHAYLMYGFPTQTEDEVLAALDYVRQRFADGHIQSAFWHRFALTAHSPIARDPASFGIRLVPQRLPARVFARNELPYRESGAPDWERLGRGLRLALYNFMLGQGLDRDVRSWFK